MKPKVLEFDGTTYTISPITVDQAENVFDNSGDSPDMRLMTKKLVAASSGIPLDQIGAMPFWIYTQLRDTALEVNGLKQLGEVKATEKPVTVN
jgi:hypothetical protein